MNGSVVLYNVKTLKEEMCLADADTKNINNACTCVSFENDCNNNFLNCTYSGGVIKLWDYVTGFCKSTVYERRQTYGITYHPKLGKFFTYGDDGKIVLYDSETHQQEFVYQKSQRNFLDGHVSKVFSMKFNPATSNEFVTGGWDSTLFYWDVRCQHAVRHIPDIFMGGDGIFFNQEGTELTTCEWKRENPLKTWDYKAASFIQAIRTDMEICHLYCGLAMGNNIIAVGGSDSHMLRIINVKTKSTIGHVKGLPGGVYTIDTMPYTKKFLNANPRFDDFAEIPILLITSGKAIYEIRYR